MREKLIEAGVEPKTLPSEMSKPKRSTHLWVGKLPGELTVGTHLLEVREKGRSGEPVFGRRTFRVVKAK